jgi:hypothetical protein
MNTKTQKHGIKNCAYINKLSTVSKKKKKTNSNMAIRAVSPLSLFYLKMEEKHRGFKGFKEQ